MKRRCHSLLCATLLSLAGLPAYADTFNLSQVTDVVAPSTRGNANTTWFGWETWDDPGATSPLNDTTPNIGTDPGGVAFQTVNGEHHQLSPGGNLYFMTTGYTLHEKVTVTTAGTVGTAGTTTIIAQFLTSNASDFPGAITMSSINGVLPTVVRGVNAAGNGQIWAKWVLPGNATTYDFTVLGTPGVLHYSMGRLVVDTHWDATTPQPDVAIPFTTHAIDVQPTVVAPTFRGAANTTYFGWDNFTDQAEPPYLTPINDSTPEIGADPGGTSIVTNNGEVHLSSSGNYYSGTGTPDETITVTTSGTVGSGGFTTIVAQGVTLFDGFSGPITLGPINGVNPMVVQGTNAAGKGQFWALWKVPGNATNYSFTLTAADDSAISLDRLVIDTHFSTVGYTRDVMVANSTKTFAMHRAGSVVEPTFRGAPNTTWFGWETWDEQGNTNPIDDSTPDINPTGAPSGVRFRTTVAEDHISSAPSSNYFFSTGTPAEEVTVLTSGTVGANGTTTIIAQIAAGGILDFPGTLVFSDINGVSPTVVRGHNSTGRPGIWVKWVIPGNQVQYTFTITGPGIVNANTTPYSFDRLVVDTIWKTGAQNDGMTTDVTGINFVMNQVTDVVVPSTRGLDNTTWFGWEGFNNFNNRTSPTPINDSTPDLGNTATGANFQTTNTQDHLVDNGGNLYFPGGTLAEQITVPTKGPVSAAGNTTIIVQITSASGALGPVGGFAETITLGSINGVAPQVVQALNGTVGGLGQLWAKWVIPGNQASYTIPITGPTNQAHYSFDRVVVDTYWSRTTPQADTMVAALAEIAVEQPVSTGLVDGTASIDFEDVIKGRQVVKTFTIRNTGPGDLELGTLTVDGTDAAAFTVGAPGQTTLETNQSTTFTVTFAASTVGAKSATLHIPSNDVDEASFDIALVAEAIDGGAPTVVLDKAGYTVSENAGPLVVKVLRNGNSDTTVTVDLTTALVIGSALSADFTLTPAITPVTFPANGVNEVTVQIAITSGDATTETNETFTVKLQNEQGATLGTPSSAPATIVEPAGLTFAGDNTAPGVSVTKPLNLSTHNVESGTPFPISGTATDNKGVRKVQYSLNNSAWTDATLDIPGGTSTAWNSSVLPLSGTNTIKVRSVDYAEGGGNAVVTASSTASPTVSVLAVPLGLVVNSSFLGQTVVGITGTTVTLSGPATATNGFAQVTASATSSPTVTVASVPAGLDVGSTLLGRTVTNVTGTTITLSGNASTNISAPTFVTYVPVVSVVNSSTLSPTVTVASVPANLQSGSTLLGRPVVTIIGTTITLSGNANVNTTVATPRLFTPAVSTPFTTAERTSTVVTNTFTVLRNLVVNISGSGTVTAGYNPPNPSYREVGKSFTITGTATSPPSPTVANPGNLFTHWSVANSITPGLTQDQILAQIGLPASSLQKQTLTFIFREGLQLTAHFVQNPFPAQAGAFNGLVHAHATLPNRPGAQPDGTKPANDSEGFFNATVMTSGAFSGKLTIDGLLLNMAGAFDHTGQARFGTARATSLVVPRTGKGSLTVALQLDVTPPLSGKITGTITATALNQPQSVIATASTLEADRAAYDGLTAPTTVNSYYLTTGNNPGAFTVILPARAPHYEAAATFDQATDEVDTGASNEFENGAAIIFEGTPPAPLVAGQTYFVVNKTGDLFQVAATSGGSAHDITAAGSATAVLDPAARQVEGFLKQDYPQGHGIGTITITKTGTVTLVGTLAEGTAVTASSTLSQVNEVALFAPLYSKKGFLSTKVVLSGTPDGNNPGADLLSLDSVLWLRPFMLNQYYPYGWPEVIKTDLLGAKYDKTGAVFRKPGGGAVTTGDTVNGNATLSFTDGLLSENLTKLVSITGTNTVTKVPDPVDPTFTITLTPTTGALSGKFHHTDDTQADYKGVIFQKGANAGAFGYFLTKQPAVIDYTGEGGAVILLGTP